MIRPYEVVYIFDSALEDEAINQKLTQFHSLIHSEGAEAPRLNHWGRRTLAYSIKKKPTGYYVVANFDTDAKLLPEFERALRLDDAVLRFHEKEHDHWAGLQDVKATSSKGFQPNVGRWREEPPERIAAMLAQAGERIEPGRAHVASPADRPAA
jgi:small subunit ribosomal protein S6